MYGDSDATAMHDGNPSYEGVTGEKKTAYCWSHVLRFTHEETIKLAKEHIASHIRDRLSTLYQTIREHTEWEKEKKEEELRTELDAIIAIETTDETANKIKNRIATQKEGLIKALLITQDGTNNLAEREFRGLAISRKITNGSDTYSGMERTAILASIVQTIHRDKSKEYFRTLGGYLREGIQKHEKHQQYIHQPLIDS